MVNDDYPTKCRVKKHTHHLVSPGNTVEDSPNPKFDHAMNMCEESWAHTRTSHTPALHTAALVGYRNGMCSANFGKEPHC